MKLSMLLFVGALLCTLELVQHTSHQPGHGAAVFAEAGRVCAPPNGNATYVINFPEDFEYVRGCSRFDGELIIGGLEDIDEHIDNTFTDLEPLNELEMVGALRIRECYVENLDGLRNLREIDGALTLEILPKLKNIDGLHNLETIDDTTEVIECDLIENLDGFVHVLRFGGAVVIEENDNILNADGIWEYTHVVEDDLYFDNNPKLCWIDQSSWEQRFNQQVHVEHDANVTQCHTRPRRPPLVPAQPNVTAVSSRSISVTFFKSNNTFGLIRQYRFFPYDVRAGVELEGRNFTDPSPLYKNFTFEITGLLPDREYQIRMSAVSLVGETSANRSLNIYRTLEDVPENMTSMLILTKNREATVSWGIPLRTNGRIVGYKLFIYSRSYVPFHLVYSGPELSYTIEDLIPDRDYIATVSACTAIGCANMSSPFTSEVVTPDQIQRINITRIGPTTVFFDWTDCFAANDREGITNYRIYANDQLIISSLVTKHEIDWFSPGITYEIYIAAYNRAGMGKSDVTEITLPATVPAGLGRPLLTISDTFVDVAWAPPVATNGIILYYLIMLDGETLPRCNVTRIYHQCKIEGLAKDSEYKIRVVVFNEVGSCVSDWESFSTTRGGLLNSGIPTGLIVGLVLGTIVLMIGTVSALIVYKRRQYRKMKAHYTTTNVKMTSTKKKLGQQEPPRRERGAPKSARPQRDGGKGIESESDTDEEETVFEVTPAAKKPAGKKGSNAAARAEPQRKPQALLKRSDILEELEDGDDDEDAMFEESRGGRGAGGGLRKGTAKGKGKGGKMLDSLKKKTKRISELATHGNRKYARQRDENDEDDDESSLVTFMAPSGRDERDVV